MGSFDRGGHQGFHGLPDRGNAKVFVRGFRIVAAVVARARQKGIIIEIIEQSAPVAARPFGKVDHSLQDHSVLLFFVAVRLADRGDRFAGQARF